MKSITEILSLLLICLVAVVLLANAPLRAGEYVETTPYTDEDEDDDGIPEEFGDNYWVSAEASESSTSCGGSLGYTVNHTDMITGTGGWVAATASSEHGWSWSGTGTPVGGTLYYEFQIDGSTHLYGIPTGSSGANVSYASASTLSYGYVGGPNDSDYVVADASGSGNWCSGASASLTVLPEESSGEPDIKTDDPSLGCFEICVSWSLEGSDTAGIDQGTSEILIDVYSECSADIWVWADAFDEGEEASSEAYAEVYSNAAITYEAFTPGNPE